MNKTTSENLSKRLKHYGALSLALAGLVDANGQIIYTPVDPSNGTTTMNNTPILIDLDNSAPTEFDIRLRSTISLKLFVNSSASGAYVLGNPSGGSLGNYRYQIGRAHV